MTTTADLRLLGEGRYVAYGSYTLSDSATSRRPLESFFSVSHTELLLVFEGSFSSAAGVGKHGFTLEVELPKNDVGKGYFVFQSAPLGELKGVLGTTESGLFILAGRSNQPPMQLSAQLEVHDQHHLSLQGLLAYEDHKWVTWSAAVKTYDPQLAKASVMSLPRRA
jgi:hypothetical protein